MLVRVVDPPAFALPERWIVITSRGPYFFETERALMLDHAVDVLITKDSGGDHIVAKLDAAGDLGIPVVIIARPSSIDGVAAVTTVQDALPWIAAVHPQV